MKARDLQVGGQMLICLLESVFNELLVQCWASQEGWPCLVCIQKPASGGELSQTSTNATEFPPKREKNKKKNGVNLDLC